MLSNLRHSSSAVLFVAVLTSVLADSVPALAQEDIFRRTSLDAVVHWEEEIVHMGVDPELADRFGPGVRSLLAEAADAWDLGGLVPSFEIDYDVTDEDREAAIEEKANWIGFADEWTYGDKLAVTVSTFDSATGALMSAQVWINPERKFEIMAMDKTRAVDSYDLQAVLTHELGHVLGLGEADDAPGATMYPTFQRGETRQRTLSEVDEQAVDQLYTQIQVSNAPSGQCSSSMPGASRAAAWPLVLFALAFTFLVPNRRRR